LPGTAAGIRHRSSELRNTSIPSAAARQSLHSRGPEPAGSPVSRNRSRSCGRTDSDPSLSACLWRMGRLVALMIAVLLQAPYAIARFRLAPFPVAAAEFQPVG